MKILHTADIHLKEFEDERWKTLIKLIDIGKEQKIDIFIIAGDLFDKNYNAEILRPKIRSLFSNTTFKIIIIPGNHDSNSYTSDMYFGEDVTVLIDLQKPFEYEGLNIWGMPFEQIDSEDVLKKLHSLHGKLNDEKTNILLYHGELLDAFYSRKDFGDEGEEQYMPLKLSYFKDLNIKYVLSGHFHSNFDIRILENGGYFVYPGSPISITKREVGQRKVNIFEVGEPPQEHLLDSPFYEQILIEIDPYNDINPIEIVENRLENAHPEAKIIFTIRGYINSEKINITEDELHKKLKNLLKNKLIEEHFELKDISNILEDDLFKSFKSKLERTEFDEKKKKQIINLAIKAIIGARS